MLYPVEPDDLYPFSPLSDRPTPEAYFGLLTDPPGTYGFQNYGATSAWTLRGSEEFKERAINLFQSFCCESKRRREDKTYSYTYHLKVYEGEQPNTWLFCLPIPRMRSGLRLFFYCQLYQRFAQVQFVLDNDNDIVDSVLLNETDLLQRANQLADSFMTYEIPNDYAVRPLSCIGGMAVVNEYELQDAWTPNRDLNDVD